MKKKLLFVISALNTGGAEKSLVNLLNLFDYDRYDIDLLLFKKEGAFLEQVPSNVKLAEPPKELQALYGQLQPRSLSEHVIQVQAMLARLQGQYYKKVKFKNTKGLATQQRWHKIYKNMIPVMCEQYDIAIAYMHLEPLYFVAEKVKAKKKIGWIHIDYKELDCNRNIDENEFKKFNRIVTISDECVNSLVQAYPMIAEKFINIPNLTSETLLRKLSESYVPAEYDKEGVMCNLLSIGRLSEQKGFDYAVDAAKLLKNQGMHFCWYIIGAGELRNILQSQIERNKLTDYVKLLGIRSNPYPYMKNADIIVQPSRFEGKSVVLDEAKILARPIVVTNYPTVQDQIQDGEEGIVVEINPNAIAEGISELWKDVGRRNKLMHYLEQHSYDNSQRIVEYYRLLEE